MTMDVFGVDTQPTVEESLDKLKQEVTRRDNEYSAYQRMYPSIKKTIEKYGVQIHSFYWHVDPVFTFLPKYAKRPPKGFLTYVESLGLIIEKAEENSVGHFRVEISGLERND